MDKDYTIARPYAKSLFDIAKEKDQLDSWQEFLETLSQVVEAPEVIELLRVSFNFNNVVKLLTQVAKDQGYSDKEFFNFIKLIAENDRLEAIPAILSLFIDLRRQFDTPTPVTVITSYVLNETQKKGLIKALSKKFNRSIELTSEVDKNMIGGIMIKSELGNFNSSVKHQLASLLKSISK